MTRTFPTPETPACARQPLHGWEKCAVGAFLLLVIAFGVLVEIRSAFLSTRKTDLDVYLRAGWAVRTGGDLYRVTDDNDWHYAYPPIIAVLISPLADAPAGQPRDWMLPYPVSVAIWYSLSFLFVCLAVHWIASALEESGVLPSERFSRRWFAARMLPMLICLCPIGNTLQRGQVNMFVVAFVARMFLETVRGRRFRSGLWLAGAICLKVFPAFLVLFPLWRRDRRALTGVAAGVLAGIVVIPSLVWGFSAAMDRQEEMLEIVIMPGLGLKPSATLDGEMLEMTATDNQSIQAVVHNYKHWDRATRPSRASWSTKLTHVAAAVSLTFLLLFAAGWRRDDNPVRMLQFLGALVVIMAIVSPVSHTHYFCLALPAVMSLCAYSVVQRPQRVYPSLPVLILLVTVGCMFTLPSIPIWEARREAGLSLFGCLILLGVIGVQLRRGAVKSTQPRSRMSGLANCRLGLPAFSISK